MGDFADLRGQMVRRQIEARGIFDPIILDAFREVPREEFVAEEYRRWAYDDNPLPIEAGQTISQPYIVALMIEAAGIKAGDKVLEVGAGSGYAAAVMSRIAAKVFGIERQAELVRVARDRLARLGYENVTIVEGDGTRGYPNEAPFDAILAAASGSHVPKTLIDQLSARREARHADRRPWLGPGTRQSDEASRRNHGAADLVRRALRPANRGGGLAH